MAANFEALSPENLCLFLRNEIPTISEDVLEKIVEHKIDGEVFRDLTDDYLREIAPLLGDRLKIKRVLAATFANVPPAPPSSDAPSCSTSTPTFSHGSVPSDTNISTPSHTPCNLLYESVAVEDEVDFDVEMATAVLDGSVEDASLSSKSYMSDSESVQDTTSSAGESPFILISHCTV
jgi:hypothetical protein